MELTEQEKKQIVVRANTLANRIKSDVRPGSTSGSDDIDHWLDVWRERVADRDRRAFAERLELSGLQIETCRQRLDQSGWPDSKPLPDWIHQLDELLAHIRADELETEERNIDLADIPFSHFLVSICDYAYKQTKSQIDKNPLSEEAVVAFKRWLLERLSTIFSQPLFIEFKTYMASRNRESLRLDAPEGVEEENQYYQSFIAPIYQDKLKIFFSEYAVLARLTVLVIQQWAESVSEFCSRLDKDLPELQKTFSRNRDLNTVTGIDFEGDSHHNGRKVFRLQFKSGVKIAYKPRELAMEYGFNEFLSWVNHRGELPTLRTVTCLSREDYGWMEWVEQRDCRDRDQVSTYYHRAGMLVCLLYALNFTDGHLENLIAAGSHPIVVDLETVLHPNPTTDLVPNHTEVDNIVRDSVLRTGLLPMHSQDGEVQETGGFGAPTGELSGIEFPQFKHVNTDAMELEYQSTRPVEGGSLPTVEAEPIQPNRYADDMISGFKDMYRFLLENREAILQDDGPLEAFTNAKTRFLFRSTHTYRKVLAPIKTSSYLREGIKYGCKIESLAKAFTMESVASEMWPIYKAERSALWRLDVPRFTVNTTETQLRHDGSPLVDILESSPLEQARQRLRSLNKEDLREQVDYISLAYAPQMLAYPSPPKVGSGPKTPKRDAARSFKYESQVIFDRINSNKKRTNADRITWNLRTNPDDHIAVYRPKGAFYDGLIGIAVFSAALTTVFDEHRYREFTTTVASPLLDELAKSDPYPSMSIGGGKGLGSLIYGFTTLGKLLEDKQYVLAARETASLLTMDRIHSDTVFDVLGGAAGAILGLLALFETTGDQDILAKAVTAGNHLLENRTESHGIQTWRTVTSEQPLTGFSHGTAGIAYSLVRLANATNESRFRDAALESLRHEREHFSLDHQNWPDLHPEAESDYNRGWCNGRSGGGLARLGIIEMENVEEIRREVELALAGTNPSILANRDHLCCGNAGRVEFLLCAGRILKDQTYPEQARTLAEKAVRRAEQGGQYTVPWQTERWYNPTFFGGESGIGYTLLRIVNPGLPCVLLWE